VEAVTVLPQRLDQLPEQLPALLIPQPQEIPQGVDDGVDAAQAVEISLPVSALALGHQLLAGTGLGKGRGGGKPRAVETLPKGPKPVPLGWRYTGTMARRLASGKVVSGRSG
jgi:hypothetical protein